MANFVNWYNTEHLHSAIGHVTPQQMQTGEAELIFERRNAVMQQVRTAYPERWGSRSAKHWESPRQFVLNPLKER
jgi:hypothetical protein